VPGIFKLLNQSPRSPARAPDQHAAASRAGDSLATILTEIAIGNSPTNGATGMSTVHREAYFLVAGR
jgi:hypothetical protein